jgi:acetylornithine deacetylase/succinyl-diaminopimelate desuccinylase-like protein
MDDQQLSRLLQDLVRIPSVNPHGDPGTPHTGEARLAEYVADFLRKLALDVELHEVEPGRPNVVAKFRSRGGRRSVAFAPHLDTVSVAGMTIDPFGGEIRDGKLYGRGACDTKGSMAAMLAALANVVRNKSFRQDDLDVSFCALMGEESGNDGARALAATGFKPDFLIAGEPTGCRVVNTHKGSLWFKLVTRGKSVHASMPEGGVNAIERMAEVIRSLPRGCTVTVIRGGSQTNIVPDICEIEIDRRTSPGEDHAQILAALPLPPERVRECPPLLTDPGNPFVRQLAAASEQPVTEAPWFCDAGVFAAHGVPAVAFGPGHATQAHTADEFVELEQVFRAAKIAERFLRAVASTPR